MIIFNDGESGEKAFQVPILDDESFEGDETVHLTLSNATGGATLGVPNQAQLTITDDDGLPHKLFFAQFGNGAGLIFSQILLINRDGDNEAFVRLIQKGNGGELLSVPLDGMIPEQGELDILIPPNGIRILQSDGQGELVTGSLTVCSDRVLAGVILFGGPTGLAGVGSSEELPDGFTAPMQSNTTSQINTGIAVQNLEDAPVTLDVELLDLDGNLIATDQIEITGMDHVAQFVTEFDWSVPLDFSNFRGTMRVSSSGRIAATAIQTRSDPNQLATLPVVPRSK